MAELRRQRLFGFDFVTGASIPEVADDLFEHAANADSTWRCVVTPNVDHLVRYDRRPAERAVAESSFMLLPDGMPIVWVSRLLRRPLGRRLAGSDLFAHMWPMITARRIPVVMVAPNPKVCELLAAQHPALRCVVPPMFDVDDTDSIDSVVTTLAHAVDEIDAQFVFVALSMAKTHLLAAAMQRHWTATGDRTPLVMLVGASPEFHLGLAKRAPKWMQRSGLEWLHRLLEEPRRMGKRYLIDDMHFLKLVWREMRRSTRKVGRTP